MKTKTSYFLELAQVAFRTFLFAITLPITAYFFGVDIWHLSPFEKFIMWALIFAVWMSYDGQHRSKDKSDC